MIVVWGTRLYGKVDEVPGMFHVATQFFYLQYVPLAPMGSYLVFSKTGEGFRGAKLGLSLKSVLVAWTRVALAIGAVAAVIVAIVMLNDPRTGGAKAALPAGLLIASGLAAGFAFWWSYRLQGVGRASYARAVQLAEKAGFTEEALVLLELAFGRITQDQANAAIADLQKHAKEAEKIMAQSPGAP